MKKMLLVIAVLAMVVGINFPTMAVAGGERFEIVNLDPGQSPPPGKITVRTVVDTVAGFNVCYWGKPGLKIEKGTAIQRWEHPNGEVVVYNLFLPNKKTAEEVVERSSLRGVLKGMKRQLDDKSLELHKASVGRQIWVDLNLENFMDILGQ